MFELTPQAGGGWTQNVLHYFSSTDEAYPNGSLIFDGAGNLYGSTGGEGGDSYGTVFELTPQVGGSWTEQVLYRFRKDGKDGFFPDAGLIFDAAGNLYGTTISGGTNNVGTVFELTPKPAGVGRRTCCTPSAPVWTGLNPRPA